MSTKCCSGDGERSVWQSYVWKMACVCVDHLKRCKTPNYAGGQWISFHPLPNEDGGLRLWYRDWSSRRTCNFPICQFSFCRQWQPAKPRTGMSFLAASGPSSELRCKQVSIYCTVCAIWSTADYVRWNSWFLQGQRNHLYWFSCHVIHLSPARL